jgi:4-hydroxy-tetrahydrodipicolinate synthase
MSLKNTLKGTGVALVTPFTEDGSIDYKALSNIIDHVIDGGCEYVVTLGTTGETPTLSKEEKFDIIHFTTDAVANRIPIVVGIGGNNTRALVQDLQTYPLNKAAAVLSASPYYNKPSQEGIYQHYKLLAEASPKPLLLYNVPGRTGRNVAAETTLRLAHEVKNIAGIKEAAGDMAQSMQIVKEAPADFLVVSGDDSLAFPQIAAGFNGVISVAANAYPKQFSSLVRAALKGELTEAKHLNDSLMEAYDLMFAENNPAGVKAFMYEMGLLQNQLRLPMVPLSQSIHTKIKAYMGR